MSSELPPGYIQPTGAQPSSIPNQSGAGSALPPAGHVRDEELKLRTDQLAEQAETQAPNIEVIDPNKIKPIPEIQRNFDPSSGDLEISNARPGWAYLWVYNGDHSRQITQKTGMGWEVVQGTDPEAAEHKAVGTYRQVGDVVLMRIPQADFDQIRAYERKKAEDRQDSVGAELIEKGRKYGVNVSVEGISGDPRILDAVAKRAQAGNIASDMLDQQIRDGQVAGMPVGR